ncbi:CLUMA_CG012901, isoform A [Clunio marinus]|uniref:Sorbitol dehydrogenase n=1 Tax=Clunio marinus TaxID=568069 RepID=A0A1J1IH63_9DIPT|nr:CLUMA_CG012901, isoform A [Clunio marinus]
MAPNNNLTAILYGIEDLRLENLEIPKIKDEEVLLEMDCVGICGSDVHYLVHGRIGDFIVEKPMIIGHEASGVVKKLGKNVKNLAVGDRVAIEPGVPCRMCEFCKTGKYNLCPDIVFCATPPYDGNLRRFYAHAADFCFKLPDHVTMEEGALLEPLSVGVHTCRRAEIQLGDIVMILGAGPIGLVSLLTAKEMGATKVIILDLIQSRLDVAKELGADYTIAIQKNDSEGELVKRIHSLLGAQPNKSLDCSGAEATNRLGLLATKSGGVFVIVGNGPPEVKVPMVGSVCREVDIRGVFRYANDYPAALALVASGKANVKRLVTHHFDITETADAFKASRYGTDGAIKVMIHCQPRNKNNPKPF